MRLPVLGGGGTNNLAQHQAIENELSLEAVYSF